MKKLSGFLILGAGLLFGVVRLLVGLAILAQLEGFLALPELAEGIQDVTRFMAERAEVQLIPISVPVFFAYIALMGGVLIAGSVGVFYGRRWGFICLYAYLALHGALFVIYLEVNPKLILWVVQCMAVAWLVKVRPPTSKATALA